MVPEPANALGTGVLPRGLPFGPGHRKEPKDCTLFVVGPLSQSLFLWGLEGALERQQYVQDEIDLPLVRESLF